MHSRNTVLLALFLTLAVQVIVALVFQNPIFDGRLNGADSYMRLHRVLTLYETGNWFEPFDLRFNAPFGELIHWTRLLDSILIAGAWIGTAFTDFPRALFVWGIFVSPLLLLVLVPIWSWGTRPVLGSGAFLISFTILPLFGVLYASFRPGNPDHHGLIALLFLTNIAIFIRLSTGQPRIRWALVAGLVAGAAIWVNLIEFLAATYFGTALALLWLWRAKPYDRYLTAYIAGLVIAITVALIVERPPSQWFSAFYERVSFVHWYVMVTVAVIWRIARALTQNLTIEAPTRKGATLRAATLAAVGVFSVAAIALVFPQFFRAPLVAVDSPIIEAWLRANIEIQSIWPVNRATTQSFLIMAGPALIGLAFVIWRWKSATSERHNLFAVLLLGYVFYLPLGLSAVRWISFVHALALLPLVMTIVAAWRSQSAFTLAKQRIPLRAVAVTVVIFGPLFTAAIVAGTGSQTQADSFADVSNPALRHQRCNVPAISAYLERTYDGTTESESGREILFTYVNWGSEIVWRTPYSVVGAPYANPDPIRDTTVLFHATSDTEAASLVRARGIDLILVCTGSFENYSSSAAANFHNRLVAGSPPNWLVPIALPASLDTAFNLYRVNPKALP
ncbi:MAG: hypothetical protein HKN28_00700 [Alphaproteobacteria bacterium]|nr:hypothetical protein [Alphaproteobacteria bacterium]